MAQDFLQSSLQLLLISRRRSGSGAAQGEIQPDHSQENYGRDQEKNQSFQKMVWLPRLRGGWTERLIMRWKVRFSWRVQRFNGFVMKCV